MKRFMKNGVSYRILPCIESETAHTPEFLRGQIVNGLNSLSSQSRWQRFFSALNRFTDRQLDYLTNLDGTDRVAWCASTGSGSSERGIALARYVRLADDEGVAEFALTVIDQYQGQGIGRELLARLIETAAANRVCTLRGYVLRSNGRMLSLCRHFAARFETEDPSTIRVEIPVDAERADAPPEAMP